MNHLRRALLGLGALTTPIFTSWSAASAGSPNAQQLLARAIRNTNSVRTLTYTSTVTLSSKYFAFRTVNRGQEDERGNRERDHESATVQTKDKTGRQQTIRYTVDVIFIHGRTYYRSSLLKNNAWQEQAGTTLLDPVLGRLGNGWARKRTTVKIGPVNKYVLISQGAQSHLRASVKKNGSSGVEDIFISNGSTPYVVRDVIQNTIVLQGQTVKQRQQVDYGPFNQALNIDLPSTGT